MRTRFYPFTVAAVVLFMVFGLSLMPSRTGAQEQGALIRLKAATFAPTAGQRPAIAQRLAINGYAAGQRGYYLVQFRGPVAQEWKDAVAATGAELLEYVPDYAFKVRMTPEVVQQVQAQPDVAWVGLFQPAYKLNVDATGGTGVYVVRVERGADVRRTAAEVARGGAQVLAATGQKLMIVADAAQLEATALVLDVANIERFLQYEKHDEYSGGVILGSNTANANGYDGSSQIAAVADTGLGGGTATTAHPDIPSSRIVQINNWPGVSGGCFASITNDGAVDVDSGHGTHVAGSVVSDGGVSGEGKGVAPAARLVFQAIENYATTTQICKVVNGAQNGYYLTGIPDDLNQLFQQAYDQGARVHSNSWGSAVSGDYTANSVEADQFTWNNKDMTITFSAGNAGVDANNDGYVDADSIGSPATAKNVITVGASEGDRQGNYQCDTSLTYTSTDAYQSGQTCSSMGGQNILGTGSRFGFTTPPISTDPTAGNSQQMAAFSSRGPTDDGRIKPDVVAPGTWELSTFSDLYQQGYDSSPNPKNNAFQYDGWGMPRNQQYKYLGGTSMSNPLVGGAAVVVRDFYNKKYGLNASSALVKASLINSAVDLQDDNNGNPQLSIPNNNEGWGRVNLVNATDGTAQFVEGAGLGTGGSASYSYTAVGGTPLKISVVWTDYPSTETATKNLVNDLNLTVTGPGGVTYRGNVFSGGWSATGGSADNTNNVENVYVQNPAAGGAWTVQINGANVPNGPQPFALVVDGAQTAPPPPAPDAPTGLSASATSSSQINLGWTDNSSNEDGFKIERCQGAGCSNFAQIATVGANTTSYSNTGLASGTSYSYRVRAYNGGGNSAYTNTASATTQTSTTAPAAPSNLTGTVLSGSQVRLNWTDNSSNEDGFKIERCTGQNCTNFAQVATVGANVTTYTDTGLASRTYYRYRVRAYNAAGNSGYSNILLARTTR